ncbi:hypothetical protein ACFWIB_37050 [Streptomyces sp. NPDC127051]|uniref:hypothetical protein n=1 Tax=Streptomyces sp. NPDC127051 TaxID=3347119 RepID=UPI003653C47D
MGVEGAADEELVARHSYTTPPGGENTPIHQLLRDLYPHWQRRLRDERRAADGRELWPYRQDDKPTTVLDLASGPSHGAGDDDPNHPEHLAARSRLGTSSLEVIGLYQHQNPDRITWDPQGDEEADLNRYHPYINPKESRRQRRRFVLNTVRVPHYWIGPKALPHPSTWAIPESAAAVADRLVLLLTPDGHPVDPRLAHLSYAPDTGLSRETDPRSR